MSQCNVHPCRYLFRFTLLTLLYIAGGWIGHTLLANAPYHGPGLFIADGVALAFALNYGRMAVAGIFFGQLVLGYLIQMPLAAAVQIAVVISAEALLGIYLFKEYKIATTFENFKDLMAYFFIVLFILQPFGALLGTSILLFNRLIAEAELPLTLFYWWFGNAMAQLLITPFLLLFFKMWRSINVFDFLLYGVVFSGFIFMLEIVLGMRNLFFIFTLTMPLVVFIIANRGLFYGLWLNLCATAVTTFAFYTYPQSFLAADPNETSVNFNLFILAYIAITMTMGVLFEERARYTQKLQEEIEKALKKNREQQLLLMRQSRLAQMGEMIAMIAHQWRQPLNNLSLINQLLISRYKKGKLNDEAIEYFKINSKKQINLMSTTIDDFRNFFKSEEKRERFAIATVIESTLEMVRSIFATRGIALHYSPADGDLESIGYPNALAQAILNILNNAKDALEERRERDRSIHIDVTADEQWIMLHIRDNAGGIPEKIIDKIFDPYFSTKKEKNGTGLGLYMSKMIIEDQMGGKILVSNDEEGAHFTIYLRKATDEAPAGA